MGADAPADGVLTWSICPGGSFVSYDMVFCITDPEGTEETAAPSDTREIGAPESIVRVEEGPEGGEAILSVQPQATELAVTGAGDVAWYVGPIGVLMVSLGLFAIINQHKKNRRSA